MRKNLFRTKLTDATTDQREEIGTMRVEVGGPYGERLFRYVHNGSGGSLTVDSLVSWEGQLGSVANTGTGTTYATRASGSFITDKVVGGTIVTVIDDAGAAGAAPEGEYSIVTKVAALRVDFSPALSAALANADTVNFLRPYRIIAAADGHHVGKVAGIPMATLADGTYGWVQVRGLYPSAIIVAAGTAQAALVPLTAGAGLLDVADLVGADTTTATFSLTNILADLAGVVAYAIQPASSDTVRRKILVRLICE